MNHLDQVLKLISGAGKDGRTAGDKFMAEMKTVNNNADTAENNKAFIHLIRAKQARTNAKRTAAIASAKRRTANGASE